MPRCLLLLGICAYPTWLCSISDTVWTYGSTKIFMHKSATHGRYRHSLHCTTRQSFGGGFKINVDLCLGHWGSHFYRQRQVPHFPLHYLPVAAELLTSFPVILAACSLNFPASWATEGDADVSTSELVSVGLFWQIKNNMLWVKAGKSKQDREKPAYVLQSSRVSKDLKQSFSHLASITQSESKRFGNPGHSSMYKYPRWSVESQKSSNSCSTLHLGLKIPHSIFHWK